MKEKIQISESDIVNMIKESVSLILESVNNASTINFKNNLNGIIENAFQKGDSIEKIVPLIKNAASKYRNSDMFFHAFGISKIDWSNVINSPGGEDAVYRKYIENYLNGRQTSISMGSQENPQDDPQENPQDDPQDIEQDNSNNYQENEYPGRYTSFWDVFNDAAAGFKAGFTGKDPRVKGYSSMSGGSGAFNKMYELIKKSFYNDEQETQKKVNEVMNILVGLKEKRVTNIERIIYDNENYEEGNRNNSYNILKYVVYEKIGNNDWLVKDSLNYIMNLFKSLNESGVKNISDIIKEYNNIGNKENKENEQDSNRGQRH